ncbi:hypothetical protein DXG01_013136 [Tephrocybe rancida]|nr:hypothetical protein DXG01_013136 [Tephrocybe rancida]
MRLSFLVASLCLLAAHGHPAKFAPFVSIPLQPVPRNDQLPPAVVHQQHANRAIRRLDNMVRSPNPVSDDELLRNLARSAAAVPPHIQKRYFNAGLDYLSRLAAHYKHKAATDGASQSFAIDGQDAAAEDSNVKDNVTPAKPPTFIHTVGLDIQGKDLGYLGTVLIGTPPRKFELLMDSGSADLWVGAEGCKPDDPFDDQEDCGTHNFLGNSSSSTFKDTKKPWEIQYGTGAVSGTIVTDTISIAGLKLPKHTFGVAKKESAEFTPDYIPFDGLLGLAKKLISRQNVTTVLGALVASKNIASPIASYHIPRLADGKNNNKGELTLGALNPARYDPKTLVSVPNINPLGFWEAKIDKVVVGSKTLNLKGRTAILDTGTTLLVAPQQDVDAMHKYIKGAEWHNDTLYWTVPCVVPKQAGPVMKLAFGGRAFEIDARDLPFLPVDEADPTGKCVSGISVGSVGGPEQWLVSAFV